MRIAQQSALLLGLIVGTSAYAYKGSISFSSSEKEDHARRVHVVAQEAGACLNEYYDRHANFFSKYKVSKFYGNRKYFVEKYAGEKRTRRDGYPLTAIGDYLRKRGYNSDQVQFFKSQMENVSCIDLSRYCLKRGFKAAGQSKYWNRIEELNQLNGNIGTILQVGLQALGWKLLYWNPDPSQNANWDADDRSINPTNKLNYWGQHTALYRQVTQKGKYYEYNVDDQSLLVGFGKNVPRIFSNAPFFLGTAHIGYHVFPGTYGKVIEAHSTRDLMSFSNMESSQFNPLGSGGGPRWTESEKYRSGIIVVPPGYM